jgi:hypothetical protein
VNDSSSLFGLGQKMCSQFLQIMMILFKKKHFYLEKNFCEFFKQFLQKDEHNFFRM